jgi:serine/threonine-protein kinase
MLQLLAICAVGALGIFAVNALRGSAPKSAGAVHLAQEPSALPVVAPPPAASTAEPFILAVDEPAPVATVAPQPSTPRPHIAPAAKPAPREGASRHAAAKPTGGGDPPTAPAKAVCDPPWTLDAQGIKQYKLECL